MKPFLFVLSASAISLLAVGCSSSDAGWPASGPEPLAATASPLLPYQPTAGSQAEATGSEGEGLAAPTSPIGTPLPESGIGGAPASAPTVDDLVPAALAILDGVNDMRQESGLPPLEGDGILFSIAFARAQDMADRKYLGHFDPQGGAPLASVMMTQFGFDGKLAENVSAFSGGMEDSASKTLEAWGGSPAFRTVMLDPVFRYSGVGLSWDGQWWKVAQLFAEVRPEGEPK